jgi:hypothetical protein
LDCQEPGAEEGSTVVAGACDFQRSFLAWDLPYRPDPRPNARHDTPLGNKVRILLESLLDVVDEDTGTTERFVLVAACRTEWVYAEDRLFQVPSREFRVIYSLTHNRSVGQDTIAGATELPGQPGLGWANSETFRSVSIEVKTYPRTRVLESVDAILEATQQGLPLNGRTELRDAAHRQSYVLEYPVKTLNYQPEQGAFQVDTGPIVVPDETSTAPVQIDRLARAHIIYNHKHLDRAEFILFRPTPLLVGGQEVTTVMGYSEVRTHPARTVLLAGDDA